MSIQKISITRALAELKLIEKKIQKTIKNSSFVSSKKSSSNKVDISLTVEEFKEQALANKQSILDNLERYKKIKSLIVSNNSTTELKVGDKTYKVAEAIERKNNIKFEQLLLSELKSQFHDSSRNVLNNNNKAQNNLDKMLEQNSSKENTKDLHIEQQALTETYLKMNEYELVDPLGVRNYIKELESEIDKFLFEVDFALSESNSISTIEI